MEKECKDCKEVKDIEEFELRTDSGKRRGQCKVCRNKYVSNYKKEMTKGRQKTTHRHQSVNGKKTCIKCNEDKEVSAYPVRKDSVDGYRNTCKVCKAEEMLEYCTNVYNAVRRKRNKNDPLYRLKKNHRCYVYKAVKYGKDKNSLKYLGCTVKNLKLWLEFQFDKHMTWENYGTYWNIDHIIPLEMISCKKDQDICLNWKNLQPLECSENFSKSDKFSAYYYFNSIVSLSRFLKDESIKEYQGIEETLCWLREKLRYGKNLANDKSTRIMVDLMGDPQPNPKDKGQSSGKSLKDKKRISKGKTLKKS